MSGVSYDSAVSTGESTESTLSQDGTSADESSDAISSGDGVQDKKFPTAAVVIIAVVVLAGAGALVYFKLLKK